MLEVAPLNKITGFLLSILAALGATPQDGSHILAVIIGLVGGTLARRSYEQMNGTKLPKSWFLMQMGFWLLIAVVVLAAADTAGWGSKMVAAVSGGASFAVREYLRRKLSDVEEGQI